MCYNVPGSFHSLYNHSLSRTVTKGWDWERWNSLMTALSLSAHPCCCWNIFFQNFLGCLDRDFFPLMLIITLIPPVITGYHPLQKPFRVRSYFIHADPKMGDYQDVRQGLNL